MSARARRTVLGLLVAPALVIGLVLAGGRLVAAGRGPARRHVVEIRGMAFQPASLVAAPGDTVVWVNRDVVPHTATSGGQEGWNTGPMRPGESRVEVLPREGWFGYACTIHPLMRGAVVVGHAR